MRHTAWTAWALGLCEDGSDRDWHPTFRAHCLLQRAALELKQGRPSQAILTVDEALEAGDTSAARFAEYGEAFRKQMEPMRKLVYAFYDDGFSFGKFLKEHPDLRPQVTDVLIGDLEKDYDDFFSVMGDFADLPEPLPHGAPIGADHTHSEQA